MLKSIRLKFVLYFTFLGRLESCEKPKDKVYLLPNMNILKFVGLII